jgi:hypothetical protein
MVKKSPAIPDAGHFIYESLKDPKHKLDTKMHGDFLTGPCNGLFQTQTSNYYK